MIYLVTGKPGHGKSYYSVRQVANALSRGRWVATNVQLHDTWPEDFASAHWWRSRRRKVALAERFRRQLHVTGDLSELVRLRVPFCGKCRNCLRGRTCMREGRGVMVLDEAHMWLNARTWDQDETGAGLTKAEATQARLKIVRFFSQHRKLGWDLYLITQDELNLDTQVRRNFEYHVHLKNLRAFRVPMIGLPVFPVDVFVAVTTWHDNDKTRLGVDWFTLKKRIANCYDTMATSHGLEWDAADAIWMDARPLSPERPPMDAPVIGRPAAAQPAGRARQRLTPDFPDDADGAGLPGVAVYAPLAGDGRPPVPLP